MAILLDCVQLHQSRLAVQTNFAKFWRRKTEAIKMSVAPLRPKGPPLTAMRAFEAAARYESFVEAAEELGVSPGAISQHIKSLEGWAGLSLFKRNAQGVELTAEGRALTPDFVAAFDALGKATQMLRNQQPRLDCHIAALPSVAHLWLPARLGKVRSAFKDVDFSVTALERRPNLERDLFDVSLFIHRPETGDTVIAPDIIVPVCAPTLARKIRSPTDLENVPLLHDRTWRNDWHTWAKAAGWTLSDPYRGPTFSLYSLAVEEAKSGAGVLMGHACLLEQELQDGSLEPISEMRCDTGRALVLGLPDDARRNPRLRQIPELLIDVDTLNTS